MATKVVIIGGGPQGLAALKDLLELNSPTPVFSPVLFDSRPGPGGLWYYSDDPKTLSTLKSTLSNVSKWRNVYSDFPIAEAWEMDGRTGPIPTYLDQAEYCMYFERYVDKFNLGPYIRFKSTVTKGEKTFSFDKVIVAVGQLTLPFMPEIIGLEKFKGPVLHSCNYKGPEPFEGKKVLVVGFSNTAADTACSLVGHAKSVHMSHRKGNAIVPRLVDFKPLDAHPNRRLNNIKNIIEKVAPIHGQKFFDGFLHSLSEKAYGGRISPEWNLSPAPSLVESAPILSDAFLPLLEDKSILLLPGVAEVIDGETLKFIDGTQMQFDAIVCATGYTGNDTFSGIELVYSGTPSLPRIYQNIFHPEYPYELAFMSYWEVPTGICETADLMSMAITQVFANRYKLPSRAQMESEIDRWHKNLYAMIPLGFDKRHKSARSRMVLGNEGPWRAFMNDAAGTGVNENLGYGIQGWKFFLQDRKLCNLLMGGFDSPHAYRLFATREGGPKRVGNAKEMIERANLELAESIETEKKRLGVKV